MSDVNKTNEITAREIFDQVVEMERELTDFKGLIEIVNNLEPTTVSGRLQMFSLRESTLNKMLDFYTSAFFRLTSTEITLPEAEEAIDD